MGTWYNNTPYRHHHDDDCNLRLASTWSEPVCDCGLSSARKRARELSRVGAVCRYYVEGTGDEHTAELMTLLDVIADHDARELMPFAYSRACADLRSRMVADGIWGDGCYGQHGAQFWIVRYGDRGYETAQPVAPMLRVFGEY